MHEKQLLFARKGDGGFNWGSACASKGDAGFNCPPSPARKGDAGFTREISNARGRRQGQAAVPVGGGEAWPGDQWAADVTNVVKPTRFTSPREDLCYKRRQSKPKNQHFHRKSRWIDDVCNNGAEIHTKNNLD